MVLNTGIQKVNRGKLFFMRGDLDPLYYGLVPAALLAALQKIYYNIINKQ
jgi:hypothetical protein